MSIKRPALRGLLRRSIDLEQAPATGLRAQLGAPPDLIDHIRYTTGEFQARWAVFDQQFDLDQRLPSIWQLRATALALLFLPGFSFQRSDRSKPGRPRVWTDRMLMQLFADIEYEKKQTGSSVRKICETLRQGIYRKRWRSFKPIALQRAYRQASDRLARDQLFYWELVGPEALLKNKKTTPIAWAIARHATKPIRN